VSPGADEVGTGVVLVVELVVDVVVVVLLLVEPPLSLPPHPTASTSIVAPPSSATVTLGSDFISYLLHSRATPDTPDVVAANMGFRADSYWRVGGFASLARDEDVDLVARFESAGLRIDAGRATVGRDLAATGGPRTGRFRRAPALIAHPHEGRAGTSNPPVKPMVDADELVLPLPGSGIRPNDGASWPHSPKSTPGSIHVTLLRISIDYAWPAEDFDFLLATLTAWAPVRAAAL
jgi:hypothetical protein